MKRPPVAVVVSFIDCINRGDVDGIAALLGDGYALTVFDEPPQRGRQAGIEGWRGYAMSFPDYVIYPHRIAATGETVAVLGHTTGSHLGLADEEEEKLTLIWLAEVRDKRIESWTLVEDNEANRAKHGLAASR